MKERNAVLLLLAASIIWGFTFAFQSQAASLIGPYMYNGIRMLIGAAVLSPFVISILRKKDKAYAGKLLKAGVFCGILLAAASMLQQIGIETASAGKAGFITSLYSLFVPVLSVFLKKKTSFRTWVCVLVGLVGAFLLSYSGGSEGISRGDAMLFGCALCFAIHIIVIDHVGKDLEGIDLSATQFLFCGLICLVMGLFLEDFSVSMVRNSLVPILYAGIGSCGFAYTFQILGQKHVHPAKATIVLSLESAWSAVGGMVILGERLSSRELCGCAILFAAVIISQLPEKHRNTGK